MATRSLHSNTCHLITWEIPPSLLRQKFTAWVTLEMEDLGREAANDKKIAHAEHRDVQFHSHKNHGSKKFNEDRREKILGGVSQVLSRIWSLK